MEADWSETRAILHEVEKLFLRDDDIRGKLNFQFTVD